MARDYKNLPTTRKKTVRKKPTRKTSPKKSSNKASLFSKLPTWAWFIAGVLATVGVMWMKANWFTSNPVSEPEERTPYSERMEEENSTMNTPPANQEKRFEPKKDPRFTFYERLPKDEIIIPQEALEVEVDKNKNKEPLETVDKQGTYVLQAGSFQEFSDADRRKAELALLGLESSIQKVSIDKRNWYRVRIGPYTNLSQLNDTRQRLRAGSIDVLVIRTE